jgi:hypothetical protein
MSAAVSTDGPVIRNDPLTRVVPKANEHLPSQIDKMQDSERFNVT